MSKFFCLTLTTISQCMNQKSLITLSNKFTFQSLFQYWTQTQTQTHTKNDKITESFENELERKKMEKNVEIKQ